MLLEVLLIGLEHAIEPREKLLRAVVRVHNDGAMENANNSVLAP